MTTLVRPDVPASLAARPWDERRNLPIPVVSMFEGKPNFAAINGQVAVDLASQRRCGLCGDPMDYWVAFLGGAQAAAVSPTGNLQIPADCAEQAEPEPQGQQIALMHPARSVRCRDRLAAGRPRPHPARGARGISRSEPEGLRITCRLQPAAATASPARNVWPPAPVHPRPLSTKGC